MPWAADRARGPAWPGAIREAVIAPRCGLLGACVVGVQSGFAPRPLHATVRERSASPTEPTPPKHHTSKCWLAVAPGEAEL